MSVDYYMAIDPGRATGIAIGRMTEELPMDVIYKAIIPEGTVGFAEWLWKMRYGRAVIEEDCLNNFPDSYLTLDWHLDVVCENFRVLSTDFKPNVEPLRIEGIIIDRFGKSVHWQQPSDKKMIGDDFLKEQGLWTTGKKMGHTDGRDANDAMLHLFAYALKSKHEPSLRAYWS